MTAAADAAFGVFVEDAVVVVAADEQAVGPIEEERLAEADAVALDCGAGHGFDAELLAGAAEGLAFEEVGEAGREAEDVEVAFVEDDAADEAGVGVDAGAEHEAAGAGFLDLDEDVLERAPGLSSTCDRRPNALLGVHLEDVQAGQVALGDAQFGVAQHLAGIDAEHRGE